MKKILSFSAQRILLIIVSAVVLSFAILYFLPAQAVSVETVGGISVRLYPVAGAGSEFVTLEYTGPGNADLTGWSLDAVSGFQHDLTGIILTNGVVVKVCEEGAQDDGCAPYQWEGNDVFDDTGDTVTISDAQDATVATLSYTPESAIPVSEFINYKTEVYAKNSKVRICHLGGKGAYKGQSVNAGNIIRVADSGKKGHATHDGDIIPSFLHNVNGGFEYYAGKGWPAAAGVYEGCL